MRIVMAVAVREFSIQPAYGEQNAAHLTKNHKRVRSEGVYQIVIHSPGLCDGFSCKFFMT